MKRDWGGSFDRAAGLPVEGEDLEQPGPGIPNVRDAHGMETDDWEQVAEWRERENPPATPAIRTAKAWWINALRQQLSHLNISMRSTEDETVLAGIGEQINLMPSAAVEVDFPERPLVVINAIQELMTYWPVEWAAHDVYGYGGVTSIGRGNEEVACIAYPAIPHTGRYAYGYGVALVRALDDPQLVRQR